MDVDILLKALDAVGLLGFMMLALYTGSRGIWVWGFQYQQVKRDRDRWQELALSGTSLAERALYLRTPEDQ